MDELKVHIRHVILHQLKNNKNATDKTKKISSI